MLSLLKLTWMPTSCSNQVLKDSLHFSFTPNKESLWSMTVVVTSRISKSTFMSTQQPIEMHSPRRNQVTRLNKRSLRNPKQMTNTSKFLLLQITKKLSMTRQKTLSSCTTPLGADIARNLLPTGKVLPKKCKELMSLLPKSTWPKTNSTSRLKDTQLSFSTLEATKKISPVVEILSN